PHARFIFNIVFFCTLVSLLVQGTTLPIMAKWLGRADNQRQIKNLKDFDIDLSNDIKSVTSEIEITENILRNGNKLMDLALPDKTLAVLVKRDNKYFVPTGKTVLAHKDKILIISDDHENLIETYKSLGIEDA